MPQRDTGDLERSLRTHSVDGYPVVGPDWFGKGFIVGEGVWSRSQLSYRVRPKNPVAFSDMAEQIGYSTRQMTLEEHVEELRKSGHQEPMHILPPEIQDLLEAGGKASQKDIQEVWLMMAGCLDENGRVTCYDFHSGQLEMAVDDLRPGMMVEFHDTKMKKEFQGRVVGVEGSGKDAIVNLEVFEPVPFMDAPEAMSPEQIRPGFYSEQTFKIGYGTHEAFEKTKTPLPPGKNQNDPESRRPIPHYILDEPIPLADIQAFCQKHYPDSPFCVWQCMILYIIPIHPEAIGGEHQGGTFMPMPTDLAMSGEVQVWDVENYSGE